MEEGKTTHSTITLLVYTDLSCPFCYLGERVLERLAQRWDDDWLELSLPTMKPGRNKVNCTVPANDGSGYYWFSRLWIWEDADGQWLRQ